jgi:hypothetical protein
MRLETQIRANDKTATVSASPYTPLVYVLSNELVISPVEKCSRTQPSDQAARS